MKEPFKTLYMILEANNFPNNKWKYDVKKRTESILIGEDNHHMTILKNTAGFHMTINGSHDGQKNVTLDKFFKTKWDVTPKIGDALEWFKGEKEKLGF